MLFRLNAAEYSDLKEKLRSPIINARNVVIRQSLTDQFLEAFRYQVSQNEVFRKPANMVRSPTKVITGTVFSDRRCAGDIVDFAVDLSGA